MENIVNTSMNNLPRNWIFSLPETTGCVCSSGSPRPHVAVEACLCSSRNENAAPRLHEADRASEIKTWPRAKEKKKKNEKRLFLSDSARPSLKDMPTSSSSAIRCHRQSYWGSYLCVRVWVNVSVTTQSPFLSIRHYSFKSHLRIVQGLWNWTGPIIWRNVFCFCFFWLCFFFCFFERHILRTMQEYSKRSYR